MNEKLNDNQNERIYVKNIFGKNVNAYVGPVYENKRSIFCQAKANGNFWKTGTIDIVTGEVSRDGEENYAQTVKVLEAL